MDLVVIGLQVIADLSLQSGKSVLTGKFREVLMGHGVTNVEAQIRN